MKLKPYDNIGCAFIHDDRGRFVPVGGVAWLQPERAQKIMAEGAYQGVLKAVEPAESPTISGTGRGQQPPLSADLSPTGDRSNSREDLIAQFLSLHHSRRKKLAKLLGAEGRIKASLADKYIRAADLATLELHTGFLGGE